MPFVQVWNCSLGGIKIFIEKFGLGAFGRVAPLAKWCATFNQRRKNPLRPACNNEIKGIESDFCLKQPRTPCYTAVLKAGQTNYFSDLSIPVSLDVEKKPWHMEMHVLSLCQKKFSCNKRPVLRASQWPNQWSHRVRYGHDRHSKTLAQCYILSKSSIF